jgi:serine/threonine protein phosphatase PrpC
VLRVSAATHQGHVRSNNEDYYATSSSDAEAGAAAWGGIIEPEAGWALIADGMGGHAAGEVASLLAVKCLSIMMADFSSEQAANGALREAMRQQPNLAGMGTTIAGIRFIGSQAICFNVGDSRIYAADVGGLRQISEDHVVEGHVLTQSLGGWRTDRLNPAVGTLPLLPSTRFLLCTDGLTDMVSDDNIAELIWSPEPATELVEAALAGGGDDNITVIVIEVS